MYESTGEDRAEPERDPEAAEVFEPRRPAPEQEHAADERRLAFSLEEESEQGRIGGDVPGASMDEAPPEGAQALDWYYARGKDLSDGGFLHEAIEAYRRVLELDPLHIRARNNVALIYDRLGLHGKALEELHTALELDPRSVEVRANLGALLGEHGRFDAAEREFRRALEIAPEDERVHFNLGLVYFRKGLYPKAIPEFERTLQIKEEHREALYYLAQSYNLTGSNDRAIALLEQLLTLDPTNHRAWWYLGMLFDRRRDHATARTYYQRSYELKRRQESGERA